MWSITVQAVSKFILTAFKRAIYKDFNPNLLSQKSPIINLFFNSCQLNQMSQTINYYCNFAKIKRKDSIVLIEAVSNAFQ